MLALQLVHYELKFSVKGVLTLDYEYLFNVINFNLLYIFLILINQMPFADIWCILYASCYLIAIPTMNVKVI